MTVAGVYNATAHILTPAVEDAFRQVWRSMCISEGWLDSKGIPTPHDGGVVYQYNEMLFVQHVADEGSVKYSPRGPVLRNLADALGYDKSANCKAMVRECAANDLVEFYIDDENRQWARMTEYGWETLKRWEYHKEQDIDDITSPISSVIEIASILLGCGEDEAEILLTSGEKKWEEGTLFYE